MSREEFLNKTLYKTELVFLKLLLPIMAFSYLLNSLACYFSVGVQLVTHYLGLVVAPMVFLLISSKVFKFCSYHRLFIYYVLVDELLLITDWYFKIPISNEAICHIHFGIAVVFFSLAVGIFIYKKIKGNIKVCKDDKINKKSIS